MLDADDFEELCGVRDFDGVTDAEPSAVAPGPPAPPGEAPAPSSYYAHARAPGEVVSAEAWADAEG